MERSLHAGDRDTKRSLVLFLWRFEFKPVLCLNYLLQSLAWFEGNLNHLGAGRRRASTRTSTSSLEGCHSKECRQRQTRRQYSAGVGFFVFRG
jgi:hypothetical protein